RVGWSQERGGPVKWRAQAAVPCQTECPRSRTVTGRPLARRLPTVAALPIRSAPFHIGRPRVFHRPMVETVFESVVSTHHGEIFRYLRRLAWRATEADDLSQETFLRAYRAWPRLTPDANVRAWLFTIATNVYKNHVRSE